MHWVETVRRLAASSSINEHLAKNIGTLTQLLEIVCTDRRGEDFIKLLGEMPKKSMEALENGNSAALSELLKYIEDTPTEELKEFLRIYTTFFHLVNSLE